MGVSEVMDDFNLFNELLKKFNIAYGYYKSISDLNFNYKKYPNLKLNLEEENKRLVNLGLYTKSSDSFISLVGKNRLEDYTTISSGDADLYFEKSPYNLITLYANYFSVRKYAGSIIDKNYLFEYISFKDNIEKKYRLDYLEVLNSINANIDDVLKKLEEDYLALKDSRNLYNYYKGIIYKDLPVTDFDKVKDLLLGYNLYLGDILGYTGSFHKIDLNYGVIIKGYGEQKYNYVIRPKLNLDFPVLKSDVGNANLLFDSIKTKMDVYNKLNIEINVAYDILKVLNNE